MPTNDYYDYIYHIDGRKLALLQRNKDVVYDPYINFEDDLFVTPSVADENAILVYYTTRAGLPTDESSDLGLPRSLELAVVNYVKHRLMLEADQTREAEYYLTKFHAGLYRERGNRKGRRGGIIVTTGPGVIR